MLMNNHLALLDNILCDFYQCLFKTDIDSETIGWIDLVLRCKDFVYHCLQWTPSIPGLFAGLKFAQDIFDRIFLTCTEQELNLCLLQRENGY